MTLLYLSERSMDVIRREGEKAYPGECCGLLIGRVAGEEYRVVRVHPCRNLRQGEADDRFEIDPRDYLEADRLAREQGLEVIGAYHSHPDHAPRPSRFDAQAAFPNFAYVIVAVRQGKAAGMRSWLYLSDEEGYREQVIVPAEDP
ncbi:MAG: M67 family metallopeptidase [Limnochordia bacterium]